ncbi:hypothetical protein [Phytohabitans rumicis]|uniref:Uncharacterized protein n=1 Tax=Phytohabitans rumicis TaxID=1076125 RepID=A0A6V8LCB7_9ACTN|nr:hypothetical protein [Phytohabitans rumicis]GFJ92638.1 hypothetical protein Prum_062800 [Phytohabitans rumicis]
MTTIADYEFRSELLRGIAAENRKIGEVLGEARAVLTVLDGRDVAVPADVRDRILACTDLPQLDTWLRRAAIATSIDDIVGG